MTVVLRFLRDFRYRRRINDLHDRMGIPADYGARTGLPLHGEARRLVSIGPDIYQRDQRLVPGAAAAWRRMRSAAADAGIELQVVSAYRSVEYQEGLLRRKLEQGQGIDQILASSAAPGFSEHHSGRALDLTTPGYPVLEEEFERSGAFRWLCESAGRFGFTLSYPRDNPHGVVYEPWHWAWQSREGRGQEGRGQSKVPE